MQQYLQLVHHILDHGAPKSDRTGTGTLSVFGYQLRVDLGAGFPLLTTKKLHLAKETMKNLTVKTGVRAAMLPSDARLAVAGRVLERARTFSDLPPGSAFWYENSNGLAEIAVNRGRADRDLGLVIGSPVEIVI